jgi:hypothetical protein
VRLQVGNGSSKARVWLWKRDDPSVYAYHELTRTEWNGLSWYFRGWANTQSGSTVMRLDAYGELMDSSTDVASYRYDANGNMTLRVEGLVAYSQSWDRENRLVGVSYGPITTTARSSYSFVYDPDGTRLLQVAPGNEKTAHAGLQYEETITPTALLVDRFTSSAANWSAQSGQWVWELKSESTPTADGHYRQTRWPVANRARCAIRPWVGAC